MYPISEINPTILWATEGHDIFSLYNQYVSLIILQYILQYTNILQLLAITENKWLEKK